MLRKITVLSEFCDWKESSKINSSLLFDTVMGNLNQDKLSIFALIQSGAHWDQKNAKSQIPMECNPFWQNRSVLMRDIFSYMEVTRLKIRRMIWMIERPLLIIDSLSPPFCRMFRYNVFLPKPSSSTEYLTKADFSLENLNRLWNFTESVNEFVALV